MKRTLDVVLLRYFHQFGFCLFALACGVNTGNPDKPAGDKNHDADIEIFTAQFGQIINDNANTDSTQIPDDSTSLALASPEAYATRNRKNHRFLAGPISCEISTDRNSANMARDLTADISLNTDGASGPRKYNLSQSGTLTAEYVGLEGKSFCLGKILIIPYLSLSSGSAHVTIERNISYSITDTTTDEILNEGSSKIAGTRDYSWEKLSADQTNGYYDRLSTSYDVQIERENISAGVSRLIKRQLTTVEPLVAERHYSLKINSFDKLAFDKWQQTTIQSGQTAFTADNGEKVLSTYQDVLFSRDGGCQIVSGAITVDFLDKDGATETARGFKVTSSENNLKFTFADGSVVLKDKSDCNIN